MPTVVVTDSGGLSAGGVIVSGGSMVGSRFPQRTGYPWRASFIGCTSRTDRVLMPGRRCRVRRPVRVGTGPVVPHDLDSLLCGGRLVVVRGPE